jgi:hypothetical protein
VLRECPDEECCHVGTFLVVVKQSRGREVVDAMGVAESPTVHVIKQSTYTKNATGIAGRVWGASGKGGRGGIHKADTISRSA